MFRLFVAAWVSLSLVGCTAMRPLSVPVSDQQAVRGVLNVGDEVSIAATNGKTYLLVLTVVDDEKIVGIGNNQKVTIRYGQIKSLEVRRITRNSAIGATTGLTLLYVGLAVITVIVLGKAFEDFGKALCLGLCEDDE